MSHYQIGTNCLHAGYRPGSGEPRNFPIVQSTTFRYETSEEMGKLFDLEASGYFYTRLQNPTNDTVAAKICALEGGTAAMLLSSGQAASFYSIFNIASCGDHVVSSSTIYGGTYNLFAVTMKRMGIEFTFVDPDCTAEELNAAFRPNTKAVFGETIANPALTVLDIEKFADAAHSHGVPLIIDNTFATPVNCRPFEWGADIVTHSTTKYMDGHALQVGGAIVDSGNFDWTRYPDKFPGLCTPDESYHGVTYTERFGLGGAYITKATVQLMRDLGSIPSPQNCFLLNIGLETLPLRMAKHCANAQAVAEYLEKHPKVAWVNYAGLPGNKYYERARKYLPNGSCGVVSFGVKGGRSAAETFMAGLKLASIATHVADAKTCVLHPASSTHRQMNDEELAAAGVAPDLVRFSVGIEDVKDIIADLEPALAGVGPATPRHPAGAGLVKLPEPDLPAPAGPEGGTVMAKETVLLYNCGGDEFKTLRALLMMLRVRVRMVEPSRYHLPLEQVAAGKGEEDPKQQADIPEAMMVFCDLGPGRLDQLLNTMRRTEFPPVLLKAVLTPTNRTWDSRQLWQELRREHEAMRGGQETQ